MTLIRRLIDLYVWFLYGMGIAGIFVGIFNISMTALTLLTVKGIDIPVWILAIIIPVLLAMFTILGYFFERYNLWPRITSRQNQNSPELKEIHEIVKDMQKRLP